MGALGYYRRLHALDTVGPPPPPPTNIKQSDIAARSVGVQLHYSFGTSVYTQDVAGTAGWVNGANFRFWRDKAVTGTGVAHDAQTAGAAILAAGGCRWHCVVGDIGLASGYPDAPLTTAQKKAAFAANADAVMVDLLNVKLPALRAKSGHATNDLSNLLHSFAGPNEVEGPYYPADGAGSTGTNGALVQDPTWARDARLAQEALWNAARVNNSVWTAWVAAGGNTIPIYAPSTQTDFDVTEATQLRNAVAGDGSVDLDTVCERANPHCYSPGTGARTPLDNMKTVWASAVGAAKTANIMYSESMWHTGPETGVDNGSGQFIKGPKTVPDDVEAVYICRTPQWSAELGGFMSKYELVNQPDPINWSTQTTINNTVEPHDWMGLLALQTPGGTPAANDAGTWIEKQQYTALKNTLNLLRDPGPPHTPVALDISVGWAAGSSGTELRYSIFQKRDGTYVVHLFRELDCWNPWTNATQGTYQTQTAKTATVSFGGTSRLVNVYCPRLSSTTPISSTSAGNSVNIPMSGGIRTTANPWPIGGSAVTWGINQTAPCAVDTFIVTISGGGPGGQAIGPWGSGAWGSGIWGA